MKLGIKDDWEMDSKDGWELGINDSWELNILSTYLATYIVEMDNDSTTLSKKHCMYSWSVIYLCFFTVCISYCEKERKLELLSFTFVTFIGSDDGMKLGMAGSQDSWELGIRES